MLTSFSLFAKQILSFCGLKVSSMPRNTYQELLTAFKSMIDQDIVVIEPFIKLSKKIPGRLVIDDTTNPKYGLKKWSRKLKIVGTSGYAQGYKILLFLWECEYGRIPLAFALWHRESKPVNELVLLGLSKLRNDYQLKLEAILADGAFSTNTLLKRLEDYGWPCVMRFRRNRKLGNRRLDKLIARGYGSHVEKLSNGVKVKIFRRKNRFFVCNRMLWSMQKAMTLYKKRWKIEEVFRVLKSCLKLSGCQQHSMQAQALYLLICLMLFSCLELHSAQSVYKTAQAVIFGQLNLEDLLQKNVFSPC